MAVTSEDRTPTHRFTLSGSGTSLQLDELERCSVHYAHADERGMGATPTPPGFHFSRVPSHAGRGAGQVRSAGQGSACAAQIPAPAATKAFVAVLAAKDR